MKRSPWGFVFVFAVPALVVVSPWRAFAGGAKPGLWEITSKMAMGAALPKLPPEQLAALKQLGVEVPTSGAGPFVVRQCMTREQAGARALPMPAQAKDGCTSSEPVVNGSTITANLTCQGEMKGTGTLSVNWDGDSSYSGVFRMTGTTRGTPVDIENEFRGRWLTDDCGDVKPPVTPKAKR
jgi:hypothetical protein